LGQGCQQPGNRKVDLSSVAGASMHAEFFSRFIDGKNNFSAIFMMHRSI
jgi:hypothetical protein